MMSESKETTVDPAAGGRHYLEILREITLEAVQGLTPGDRLSRLVTLIATRLRWDVCSIYLLDRDDGRLLLAATHGLNPDAVGRLRLSASEGLVGAAVSDDRPLFLTRAAEDARFKYLPETGEERYTSMAAVPLHRHGQVSGVLAVQTVAPYDFTVADRHFLEVIAGQLGPAVDVAMAMRTLGAGRRQVIIGHAAAPGFAAARVHLFSDDPDRIVVAARGSRGFAFEEALFSRAIATAVEEIAQVRVQIATKSEAAAMILVAHEMILRDAGFTSRVREEIRARGESAPRAVAFVMEEYIEKFQAMESPIFREKAQDLRDLRDHLLGLMMDKKITRFAPEFEEEAMVIVARELTPQQTIRLDASKVVAIVTEEGGPTSHAAILARALGLPAVVGARGILQEVKPEDRLFVDGADGLVILNPGPDVIEAYEGRRHEEGRRRESLREAAGIDPAATALAQTTLDANIGLPFEVDQARREGLDAVGLLRTEFFYMQHASWPGVAAQAAFYERLFRAFAPRPVTVRLLDVGADKKLGFLADESQNALGLRSIRLLLARPELLASQLEAIHVAAERVGLRPRILVPMVTQAWEVDAVREALARASGGARYPLGIMVEVPAALFAIEDLTAQADFVSIGTNDLAQYLMAADRTLAGVARLSDPLNPAFLRAMSHLFRELAGLGKRFTVCGEIAGNPPTAAALMALGYRKFSIAPSSAAEIRYLLRHLPREALASLHSDLLKASDASENDRLLRNLLAEHAPLVA